MEREDLAASRLRVEEVGELGLDAGRLVQEWQRPAIGGEGIWETFAVALALSLDARERPTLLLGLNRAGRGAIDVEEVVDWAALEGKLANGHTRPGAQIRGSAVLQDPASVPELLVDFNTRSGFRVTRHPI
jgi:hypothetical protein